MPSVTPDDVLQSAKRIWDADSLINSLVPGGFWHGRPTQDTVYPFAIATVEEGEREEFSGVAYVQPFTLTIQVRDAAASPQTDAIRARLAAIFDRAAATITMPGSRVLHVKPKPGKLEKEQKQKDANDVLLTAASWEFMVQSDRG